MSSSRKWMTLVILVAMIAALPAGAETASVPGPAPAGATVAPVMAAKPARAKPAVASRTAAAKSSPTPSRAKTTAAAPKPAALPREVTTSPAQEPAEETLRGGQEGTVFRSLTIEGEDRIHFEVERPELRLEVDPTKAPGLDWGTARDVLDRTIPDQMAPLLGASSKEASPYTGRPWLSHFATGSVARFQPNVEGVENWKLTVANWRGEPVKTFTGKGDPPKEIAWDGRNASGAPVTPGATYSYVFEAVDKAGNRRHFVGEGFRVNAFRVASDAATMLVFTGAEMAEGTQPAIGPSSTSGDASPVILEAASWLNQSPSSTAPITVTATARSGDEASALVQRVQQQLGTLLIGDAARIRAEARVESDAPPGGAVAIATGRAPAAMPPATSRKPEAAKSELKKGR